MRNPPSRSASNKRKAREARSEAPVSCDKVDRSPRLDDPADQPLRHAVENKVGGLESLQAVRLAITQLTGQILRLQELLDHAFGYQLFLPNLSPTCPANRRRFNTYFHEFMEIAGLLGYAIELWSLTYGLKTDALVADIHRRVSIAAYRQTLNQNAAASAKSAPGEGPHACAGKTDRVPVTPMDIGRAGSSPANKSPDAKKTTVVASATEKGGR